MNLGKIANWTTRLTEGETGRDCTEIANFFCVLDCTKFNKSMEAS